MNAVLVVDFESWHPVTKPEHEPNNPWQREGSWRVFFVKSDKFDLNDYQKMGKGIYTNAILEGKISENTLDVIDFIYVTFSVPINMKSVLTVNNMINKGNYDDTAKIAYKASVNEIVQRLRCSYSINKVLFANRPM
jgi:hypothetical protein